MLTVVTKDVEYYDEKSETFSVIKGSTFTLEHSLLSVSKWESKWEIPFLTSKKHTDEQVLDYVLMMDVNSKMTYSDLEGLSQESFNKIQNYISKKHSATVFSDQRNSGSREAITSELIYYWMISHNIPFEAEKWHLSRLLTLIQVCNRKNTPPKKMSKSDIAARNRELNAHRRAQFKTKG